MIKHALALTMLLAASAATASAQLISIRTVPVSQGHQFEIFPSNTLAMGGVSIALADSLLDPFTNPALGARLGATRFFGSPSVYSVSSEAGGGRTLPIGALTRSESWYGGVWLAIQEVDAARRDDLVPLPFGPPCIACSSEGIDLGSIERSHRNTFAFATVGKTLKAAGVSIGGSVLWSDLNAVDGVDLLYSGSARIDQAGHALDVRLGMLKEWSGERSLEAVALHHRFATTHDVAYLDLFWDPGTQQFARRPRIEQNLDRTNTWGLHLNYQQPLSAAGWRMGWVATVNRMDHPKIPNYSIMNIPRDPGNSSAFNFGFGVARALGASTFGMDVIYEPIWSHTWADAAEPVESVQGRTIPPGGMTIENHFRFSNAQLRMGVGQEFAIGETTVGGIQLGVGVHSIHYWLDQEDHVQLTQRDQEERWTEWTPTWGLNLRFPELEIRYRGSVTNGTGRPGIAPQCCFAFEDRAAVGSNILVAPSGPLTLDEVRVMTHQISLSLPMR